jgi:hypothetical protein
MSTRAALATIAVFTALAGATFAVVTSQDSATVRAPLAPHATAVAAVQPLPAPQGRSILTLLGVKKGNSGASTTKLDYATVDGLAHERVVVYEPFVKRNVTFTGIRVSEFIRATGFPPATARLAMHAVDDYNVDLSVAAMSGQGFLATRAGGKSMTVAKGGPVRLVFLKKGGLANNTDNWIWSIDRIKAG